MWRSGPRYTIVLLLALGLVPAFAAAQPGPRGPDIMVTTENYLACPTVAISAHSDFEVIWSHYFTYSHPTDQGIYARHFDRQGQPTQPAAIRLDVPNGPFWRERGWEHVVALPGAGYFVVWGEQWDGESRWATFGRFLDSEGNPRSRVLLLKHQAAPMALALVRGELLVAWKESPSSSVGSVWARRFDLAGHALGEPMLLTRHQQLRVLELALLADSFVAVWERLSGTSWVVEARRFSLAGKPLGAALRLNDNRSFVVKVAANGKDRYAVAWTEQTYQPEFHQEPRVQFFDLRGALGPATNPSGLGAGNQSAWGVAMDSRGSTLVTWTSPGTGSGDVMGRFLDSTGQPAGEAFSLAQNVEDSAHVYCPYAATSANGDAWVAAWLRQFSDIFARRLALAAPGGR